MQLPVVSRANIVSLPPMYAWPQTVKRALLFGAVLGVIGAYVLLGGGIIALLALLTQWAG